MLRPKTYPEEPQVTHISQTGRGMLDFRFLVRCTAGVEVVVQKDEGIRVHPRHSRFQRMKSGQFRGWFPSGQMPCAQSVAG